MTIIDEILESPCFVESPPVLVDIGASGAIHPKWQPLAKYSICIAFDADEREMGYAVNEAKGYRKLYLFNSLVSDRAVAEADFYLTRFPLCSSTLEPDQASINNWNFGNLFEVERKAHLQSVTLTDALRDAGLFAIDWFKTDSQGTDLRLFASLGSETLQRTLIAEFEPGIIDAYKGEDKLHHLMAFMDNQPFWVSDMTVHGTQRISRTALIERIKGNNGAVYENMPFKTSPCWASIAYCNTFLPTATCLTQREYLLGWIFALIEGQYGFGLDIALQGGKRFGIPVFEQLAEYSVDLVTRTS